MKSSSPNQQQKSLFTSDLIDCLNPSNRLYQLASQLPWSEIEMRKILKVITPRWGNLLNQYV
jgi:hypothetical protein